MKKYNKEKVVLMRSIISIMNEFNYLKKQEENDLKDTCR